MKRTLLNVGLFLLTSVGVLLVMEVGSRFFLRSAHAHVVDKSGHIVSMQLDPGNPAAGLKPYFEGRMISGEFDVSIRLDSLGLRGSTRIGSDASVDTLQVMILGDSFMFGWGVEPSESFAYHLAECLSHSSNQSVTVMPVAVPGTGQFSQLSLMSRVPQAKPDIVLLGLYVTDRIASGNDLIENLNECYQFGPTGPRADPGEASRLDFLRRIRRWLKNHSNLYRFVEARLGALVLSRMSNAIKVESDPRMMARAWAVTDSVLLSFKQASERRGAQFVIQYVPNMLDFIKNDSTSFVRLRGICTRRNILLVPNPIDLFNANKAENGYDTSDFYYLGDGHWTSKAHQIAACATAEFLATALHGLF